jgi:hypothetical protein
LTRSRTITDLPNRTARRNLFKLHLLLRWVQTRITKASTLACFSLPARSSTILISVWARSWWSLRILLMRFSSTFSLLQFSSTRNISKPQKARTRSLKLSLRDSMERLTARRVSRLYLARRARMLHIACSTT